MAMDIFGETRIRIEGNPKLEGIANHILQIYKRMPEILDGDTIGQINRKVNLEIMLDNGLRNILNTAPQTELYTAFQVWYLDKKQNCDTEEETARALRYLVERDYLRLPAKAITSAEQHRERIARSVKG